VADSETPFLKRWSERKLEDARTADAPISPSVDNPPTEMPPEDAGAPEVDLSRLPDVESLDADSDFTGFLQDGVPDELRQTALRALWRSTPLFGHRDGLNDYDDDYSIVEDVIEAIQSAWQPGRGYEDDVPEEAPEDRPREETPENAAAEGEKENEKQPAAAPKDGAGDPEISEEATAERLESQKTGADK